MVYIEDLFTYMYIHINLHICQFADHFQICLKPFNVTCNEQSNNQSISINQLIYSTINQSTNQSIILTNHQSISLSVVDFDLSVGGRGVRPAVRGLRHPVRDSRPVPPHQSPLLYLPPPGLRLSVPVLLLPGRAQHTVPPHR